MKTKSITVQTGNILDPILEELLKKRDVELKILAEKYAKTFGERNLPASTGDNLVNYIGEIKGGYEKLAAEMYHSMQPDAHLPEAKIDADYFRGKAKGLVMEINDKEAQNKTDENHLKDFAKNNIPSRIAWAMGATMIVTLGEVMFNTKSFQVTGENLLFALVLSICISFAVFVFSHMTPMLFKEALTKLKRIAVVVGSLLLVTLLFSALAIFRSTYLASHDVHIKPTYFVIINLFFFIVSSLVSFFVMPSWAEVKENGLMLKLHYAVKKRKKDLKKLKIELDRIQTTIMERTKVRIRIAHYTNYAIERIRKMYAETVGVFKTNNIIYRTDNKPPDCFEQDLLPLEIDSFYFTLLPNDDNDL